MEPPLDFTDIPLLDAKTLKAMMEETEAYINCPKSEWK